jgi:hypothetical protein
VICVGLDAPVDASDALGASRSQLYRAITRAHMLVLVVNELVRGGWLEFFPRVLEYFPRPLFLGPSSRRNESSASSGEMPRAEQGAG